MKLLGYCGTAHHVAVLHHPNLQTGLGKIKSADQAIVPGADDDRIISLAHAQRFGAKWKGIRPTLVPCRASRQRCPHPQYWRPVWTSISLACSTTSEASSSAMARPTRMSAGPSLNTVRAASGSRSSLVEK